MNTIEGRAILSTFFSTEFVRIFPKWCHKKDFSFFFSKIHLFDVTRYSRYQNVIRRCKALWNYSKILLSFVLHKNRQKNQKKKLENENEMPSTGEAMQTKYERFAKRTQCRRPTSAILKNKSIDNNKGEFISLIRCSLDVGSFGEIVTRSGSLRI